MGSLGRHTGRRRGRFGDPVGHCTFFAAPKFLVALGGYDGCVLMWVLDWELGRTRHALSVGASDGNVLCNGDANQMDDEQKAVDDAKEFECHLIEIHQENRQTQGEE